VFLQAGLGADDTLPDLRADDRLLAPSGQEVSVRDAGNLSRVIEPLTEPGIYTRSRAGSDPEPALVANFDRAESRLDTATPDELAEWTGFKTFRAARTPEALLAAIDDLHNGRVLAEPLLWFILLLALTEWWFANRTLRKGSKLTDTLTIDPAGKVSGTT
jgi:hypothetical protein